MWDVGQRLCFWLSCVTICGRSCETPHTELNGTVPMKLNPLCVSKKENEEAKWNFQLTRPTNRNVRSVGTTSSLGMKLPAKTSVIVESSKTFLISIHRGVKHGKANLRGEGVNSALQMTLSTEPNAWYKNLVQNLFATNRRNLCFW